jgi:prepilin signal peptidase PulO-like enzyme (type II secretory pathway)
LVGILLVASYFDLRYLTIPKQLCVIACGLGLAANLARGLWLGIETDQVTYGLLVEGLLFSLLGFATGFVIFFALWILGLCGGGDVKLFTAVATWLGMRYTFWLWIASILAVVIFAWTRLLLHTLIAGVSSSRRSFSAKANPDNNDAKGAAPGKSRRRLVPFSLPLAIAAVVVLLWFFRAELHLIDRPVVNDPNAMASIHP